MEVERILTIAEEQVMGDYSDILTQIADLAEQLEAATQKMTGYQEMQLELRRQLLELYRKRSVLAKRIEGITG